MPSPKKPRAKAFPKRKMALIRNEHLKRTTSRPLWRPQRVVNCVGSGLTSLEERWPTACVPDGYRNEQIEPIRAQIKKEAEKVVEIMAEKYGVEDDYAKEALHTAVEIMRVPGETRERLSAARLVLDFTKQKPVAKSEVAVAKAEEFLSSLLTEEDDGSEAKSGS